MSYNCFCFTLNNYTDEDLVNLEKFIDEEGNYFVCGKETAPETGTPHLQGYFELLKKTRMSKKLMNRFKWHIEPRKGSQNQAIAYCKKGEQSHEEWSQSGVNGPNYGKNAVIVEHGQPKQQGKRNDLDEIRLKVAEGGMRSIVGIASANEIKCAEKFLEYREEPRNKSVEPHIIWMYGGPGLGKTRMAHTHFEKIPDSDVYLKRGDTGKWWQGYDGHKHVILDEFRDSHYPWAYILGLLDRYPFTVETKGGARQMKSSDFVITSCFKPDEIYQGCAENRNQLLRRIKEIWHFVDNVIIKSRVLFDAKSNKISYVQIEQINNLFADDEIKPDFKKNPASATANASGDLEILPGPRPKQPEQIQHESDTRPDNVRTRDRVELTEEEEEERDRKKAHAFFEKMTDQEIENFLADHLANFGKPH